MKRFTEKEQDDLVLMLSAVAIGALIGHYCGWKLGDHFMGQLVGGLVGGLGIGAYWFSNR